MRIIFFLTFMVFANPALAATLLPKPDFSGKPAGYAEYITARAALGAFNQMSETCKAPNARKVWRNTIATVPKAWRPDKRPSQADYLLEAERHAGLLTEQYRFALKHNDCPESLRMVDEIMKGQPGWADFKAYREGN